MKKSTLAIFVILIMMACANQKEPTTITINGNVKGIPDGWVYLTEAHYWQVDLDSTRCVDGHFTFNIQPDSKFIPYMASINWKDRGTQSGQIQLMFTTQQPVQKKNSKPSAAFNSAFYLEKGISYISIFDSTEITKADTRCLIKAGPQNDAFAKNYKSDFGWLGNIDSVKREVRINYFKRQIKLYPFSYYLFQSILDNKEQYSKPELTEIISLFNIDLQNSLLGKKMTTYFRNRVDPGKAFVNILLPDSGNMQQHIVDLDFKLNMLVFWASWCGPCRHEIATLKKVYQQYNGKGLRIASISIDEDKSKWKDALFIEKMHWPQLIASAAECGQIKQQFNFSSIPLIVFVDNKGMEVKRFLGYEDNQLDTYKLTIDKFINQQ